jgi:hypothetical protein
MWQVLTQQAALAYRHMHGREMTGEGQTHETRTSEASAPWRSRITGYGTEPANQLLANPRNWRIHPKAQQEGLGEIGSGQNVLANQRYGLVIDRQARVELTLKRGESEVSVTYVELSEEDED